MAGRNSKLTPDRQERICDALRNGNTRRVAAILGGISEATFYNWVERANPEHAEYQEKYLQFLEAVKEAEADAEADSVQGIKLAARNSWQAHAWFLERKNPKDWARREHVDLTSKGDKLQNTIIFQAPDDGTDIPGYEAPDDSGEV